MSKNNLTAEDKSLAELNNFNKILIRDAKVYDPFDRKKYMSDVLIERGLIKSIGRTVKLPDTGKWDDFHKIRGIKISGDMIAINAEGYILCPAFMDMHVHLRDPGDEYEETVESGISAALTGGITALACMPNTEPPLDNEVLIKYLLDRAGDIGFKLFPVAAMTKKT